MPLSLISSIYATQYPASQYNVFRAINSGEYRVRVINTRTKQDYYVSSYCGYRADKLLDLNRILNCQIHGKGSQIKDHKSETSATRKVFGYDLNIL